MFKSGPCIKMLKSLYRESTRMVNELNKTALCPKGEGDSVHRNTDCEFSYRTAILITTMFYIEITNCWHSHMKIIRHHNTEQNILR
jgi:hypothetical protein